jgi:NitT/TauT family transport system substrate-binding protein
LALRTEMTDYALDPTSVHWVQVPYTNAGTYLRNHRVDAAVETDPYRTQTHAAIGAVTVVKIFAQDSGFADFPISAYVTTEQYATAHPDVIAAFQRAMLAADNLTAHPENVKTAILNHTQITHPVADVMDMPEFPADLDPHRLGRVVTMLQKATPPLVPPSFQVGSMILPMPTS